MARTATPDSFTTTANVDAVRRAYGDDDSRMIPMACGRCGGDGWIRGYERVEGGRCFECGGNGGHYTESVGSLVAKAHRRDLAEARRARKAAAKLAEREAWHAEHADLLARATAAGCSWWENWRDAPTAEHLAKLTAAVEEREARKAADEARKATAAPVPEGREVISGVVLAVKLVEDHFSYSGGTVVKVLVQEDRGFRVYGTAPRAILDAAHGAWLGEIRAQGGTRWDYGPECYTERLKGARVEFTATMERSSDDPIFGFFKRACKATLSAAA